MADVLNPYYLKTLDDFYALHSDIQNYLKEYYILYDSQNLIKATSDETIQALVKDWEEVEADSIAWDLRYGHEHKALSPALSLAQDSVAGFLRLFNSVLAILFRSDWGPYQERLFGSWTPIGVAKPSSDQEVIRVLNWPRDCFEESTCCCNTENLEVMESGLVLYRDSGEYVLFWKPEIVPLIPLDQLVRFDIDDHTDCTLNLWEDNQIKNILEIC